jgi:hypothetical protein
MTIETKKTNGIFTYIGVHTENLFLPRLEATQERGGANDAIPNTIDIHYYRVTIHFDDNTPQSANHETPPSLYET